MSKFFRVLLDAHEPMFSASIRQLEKMTSHKSVDLRYMGEITERAHAVMRKLGLDPSDSTERELYHMLSAHVQDERLFANTDDVALVTKRGEIISFNIDDIKSNLDKPYEARTFRHVRCQVKHGLMARYVAADGDDEQTIEELVSQAGIDACDMEDYHEQKASRESKKTASVLCVGDIFTDVFIKLSEDEARIETDRDGSKRLSLPFGNKPPYDRADVVTSVGPSPNAAVAMARLGLNVELMSWLGDDQVGKDSLRYLASEAVDTTLVNVQPQTPSSTYYVLRYGADRTILVKNQAYEYRWREPATPPDWIYLSLLSPDSWQLHRDLLVYLERNPSVKLAFQPGTFHFKWGAKKLAKFYQRAEIVVMNREEAADVTGKPHDVVRQLAEGLHALGPRYVVITDGADGSYASFDGQLLRVPNYPDPAPPSDRTGAGDAFASTIVGLLALGESFERALSLAPINSMSVVQKLGAQAGLLTRPALEKLLKKAPKNYKIEEYTR